MASILEYPAPAAEWLSALPLGDGARGAMLDGGVPELRIAMTDETAWSGSPASEAAVGLADAATCAAALADARAAVTAGDPVAAEAALTVTQAAYSQAFLPFATVLIRRTPVVDGEYRRRLDFSDGRHETVAGSMSETTVLARGTGVLVHVVAGAGPVELEIESPLQELTRTRSPGWLDVRLRLPSDVAPGHEPDLPGARWEASPGSAIEGAIVARVLEQPERERTVVLVATASTFVGIGAAPAGDADSAAAVATARVDAVIERGIDAVLAVHAETHRELMGRVELDLGAEGTAAKPRVVLDAAARIAAAASSEAGPISADPSLVGVLFDYGRYLLVASAIGGVLPPTLQGIWNDELRPPWSSNYTLNINTPMNHWAALPTALPEALHPLWDLIEALAVAGTPTADRLYGARGWVAHHNTDAWAFTNPVGRGHGDARWTAWPLGGLWLLTHVADALRHGSIDDDRLDRLAPAILGAAAFALDWTRLTDAGLSTAPATSPENAYIAPDGRSAAIDETTTLDLALIRSTLELAIAVADHLDDHEGILDDAAALLAMLPTEPAIGSDGLPLEWARERTATDPHHRHVSHLAGLAPLHESWSSSALAAAERALVARGDDSAGWSIVWKAMLWSRLGRGDKVADLLSLLLRPADAVVAPWAGGLYPNLFAAHPPFQIDANLGFPAVIVDSIARSDADGILLLPALPTGLDAGSLRGVVLAPGIRVDVHWRERVVTEVALTAERAAAQGPRRVTGPGVDRSVDLAVGVPLRLETGSGSSIPRLSG